MSAYPYSTRVVEALGCRLYKSWILSCRVNYTNSFILYEFTNLKIDIWDKSMFFFFVCVCVGGGAEILLQNVGLSHMKWLYELL